MPVFHPTAIFDGLPRAIRNRGNRDALACAQWLSALLGLCETLRLITDLAEEINHDAKVETDVLVVGAGIAGIFLAVRLRRLGIRVVILESGSRTQAEQVHPLNRVVQLGESYNGASAGRFRCLGGTSTRWGGALIPFAPNDLLPRTYLNLSGFPIEAGDITKYINDVEGMFGVDDG